MADFFDKLKSEFDKGMATVSIGSKNFVEKSKINSTIKTFEDEKRQLLEILGTKMYLFYATEQEGEFPRDEALAIVAEVQKRDEMIAQQQARLQEMEEEINQVRGAGAQELTIGCTLCGHPNNVSAKFCSKCGNQLGAIAQPIIQQPMGNNNNSNNNNNQQG